MKVILTGGTGFLGKYLYKEFKEAGEDIITLGRLASNDISCDLKQSCPQLPAADMLIHAAGKAHVVPRSEEEKKEFHDINFIGTKNLIEGLHQAPKIFIFISSVAVYGLEVGELIHEEYPLLGSTPYALSKIEAEKYLSDWADRENVKLFIFRLPLIFGEYAPGNLGRMEQAIKRGYYFRIGNGQVKKSIVDAEGVAKFCYNLEGEGGIYNLTTDPAPKLNEIEKYFERKYGRKILSIPFGLISFLAKIGDLVKFFPINSAKVSKLTNNLTYNSDKAKNKLRWNSSTTKVLKG